MQLGQVPPASATGTPPAGTGFLEALDRAMREYQPTGTECSRAIEALVKRQLRLHEGTQQRSGGASGTGSSRATSTSPRVGEGGGQGARPKTTRKGKGTRVPSATVSVPPSSQASAGACSSPAGVGFQYPPDSAPVLVPGPDPYYECPLRDRLGCMETAAHCDTMRGHVREVHYGTRVYLCPHCPYSATCRDNLRRHLSRCKDNPNATEPSTKKKKNNPEKKKEKNPKKKKKDPKKKGDDVE